jgi:hypothetical protein
MKSIIKKKEQRKSLVTYYIPGPQKRALLLTHSFGGQLYVCSHAILSEKGSMAAKI